MNNNKNNNKKGLIKGAIIGFIASILLAILFTIGAYLNFLQNPSVEVGCLSQNDCMIPVIFVFLSTLIYSIPLTLIGGIIGYLAQKIKKDKS